MSDELLLFEFLESDNSQHHSENKSLRRSVGEKLDPFTLDDVEFVRRYRLSKDLTRKLCDEIKPMMREPTKSTDLSLETKLLTALSFYATGSYQRPTGDIASHSMAQQTVSATIAQITACLNCEAIRRKYIVFPNSLEERNRNKTQFYNKFGIPGVLGCIDCSHLAIVRPREHEERFYCRKQYHSLNVQLVCNADMQIISVDASYGGATHDSFIWANHPINLHLENLNNTETTWLLGDSGYPLRRTMMTPFADAVHGSPEAYYTEKHIQARNTIERTIGLLKARFRCLLVHRVLHYEPQVAGSIVNACAILHNICISGNVPILSAFSEEDSLQEAQLQSQMSLQFNSLHPFNNNRDLNVGISVRQSLIHRMWESRAT